MEEDKIIDIDELYPELKRQRWIPKNNEELINQAQGDLWVLCELARIEERKRLTEGYIQERLLEMKILKNYSGDMLDELILSSAEEELTKMGEFLFGVVKNKKFPG